jgi:hypothetical protein
VAFGAWPVEAAVRVHTGPGSWRGLGVGSGLLGARELDVRVEVKGVEAKGRGFARAG